MAVYSKQLKLLRVVEEVASKMEIGSGLCSMTDKRCEKRASCEVRENVAVEEGARR